MQELGRDDGEKERGREWKGEGRFGIVIRIESGIKVEIEIGGTVQLQNWFYLIDH